jgi:hypothetical protein
MADDKVQDKEPSGARPWGEQTTRSSSDSVAKAFDRDVDKPVVDAVQKVAETCGVPRWLRSPWPGCRPSRWSPARSWEPRSRTVCRTLSRPWTSTSPMMRSPRWRSVTRLRTTTGGDRPPEGVHVCVLVRPVPTEAVAVGAPGVLNLRGRGSSAEKGQGGPGDGAVRGMHRIQSSADEATPSGRGRQLQSASGLDCVGVLLEHVHAVRQDPQPQTARRLTDVDVNVGRRQRSRNGTVGNHAEHRPGIVIQEDLRCLRSNLGGRLQADADVPTVQGVLGES